MPDIYNLTDVESTTNIPDFIIEMNVLSNGWIGGSLVILSAFVSLVTFKALGIDTFTSMLASASLAFFVSSLSLYFGFINWIIFTLSIVYFAMAMVMYWSTN